MISAIQSVPSAYSASQIIGSTQVVQQASLANSLQALPGTTVDLGSTNTDPLTYNATGLLDRLTPAYSATSDSRLMLISALNASSIAKYSAALDQVLADALAEQQLINARVIATGQPLPTPTASGANQSGMATSSIPVKTTNAAATSNTTSGMLSNTPEVVNNPPSSKLLPDAATQALSTIAANPAYPSLVAGQYVSMAATAAQSPSVMTTPITFDETQPVIAISAITALGQLGDQSGRDGNPPPAYRQRQTNSMPR